MNKNFKECLFKPIKAGLKETIKTHGPITKNLIGSATKRIASKIKLEKNFDEQKKKNSS